MYCLTTGPGRHRRTAEQQSATTSRSGLPLVSIFPLHYSPPLLTLPLSIDLLIPPPKKKGENKKREHAGSKPERTRDTTYRSSLFTFYLLNSLKKKMCNRIDCYEDKTK